MTNSATPAIPEKSTTAKPVYSISCEKPPVSTSSALHTPCATIAAAGVRQRGWTRAATGRNTPSRAMA